MDIVLDFYKDLPFNIKSRPWLPSSKESFNNYCPSLIQTAFASKLIVDIGCGPGHLINSLNYQYLRGSSQDNQSKYQGIDFNPTAINYAREIVRKESLNTEFFVKDVFDLDATDLISEDEKELFIISIGALHHTRNCLEAITQILKSSSIGDRKISFLIGLYHLYGRKPFLSHFAKLKERGWSEAKLNQEFAELRGVSLDIVQDESWFEDQVNHPRETQHTLKEIYPIFMEFGFHLDCSSIDRFQRSSVKDLISTEVNFEAIAEEKLMQRKYFPGFFTCLFKNY